MRQQLWSPRSMSRAVVAIEDLLMESRGGLHKSKRGVDVGATAEIHQTINELVDQGLAVVGISSYLLEIVSLSARNLVCRQERLVEEFAPADSTEAKIMPLCTD
ncbi:hypothetical protein [Rhizobium leguminosarum]|uniref:hypothetical protein n=1 Tax=Rhizobium leguminosarum TaxID=384 RepID=UPI003D7C322A